MRSVLVILAMTLLGCASLQPPRPLAADEVFICMPGSAVARRVRAPAGWKPEAAHAKRGVCGFD